MVQLHDSRSIRTAGAKKIELPLGGIDPPSRPCKDRILPLNYRGASFPGASWGKLALGETRARVAKIRDERKTARRERRMGRRGGRLVLDTATITGAVAVGRVVARIVAA